MTLLGLSPRMSGGRGSVLGSGPGVGENRVVIIIIIIIKAFL